MKRLVLLLGLVACTNDDGAYQALAASGFRNIVLTGYEMWACGKDDTCTGFEAIGPTGVKVRGAVGCGMWGKGCTVRITGTR